MAARRKYRDGGRVPVPPLSDATAAAPAASDAPAVGAMPNDEDNPLLQQLQVMRTAEATLDQRINKLPVSEAKRAWLIANPRYVLDAALEQPARIAYQEALKAGIEDDSPDMFAAIERSVEAMTREQAHARLLPPPLAASSPPTLPPVSAPARSRAVPMSAPVSRETGYGGASPSEYGKIKLTAEQREAARIAGVDDFTYAKGVQELERRKKMGMYSDR
jgi:hypothetical protein